MAGQLAERLPISRSQDDFDKLAGIVNTMLDEIERLMCEVKGVGDAIAHDLRTPLGRLRGRLERARDDTSGSADALRREIDEAIAQLDDVVNTMQALLRIGEIERGRRRAAFATLDIAETAREVGELFAPLAEDKNVALTVLAVDSCPVIGDRELLFEALTNLVDNAIKFAPGDGHVQIDVARTTSGVTVSVNDDGPGIPPDERDAVLRLFYRSDRSRHTRGTGLGLSLVAAIVQLHGFQLAIETGSGNRGCRIVIRCWPGYGFAG
jgi:signal transduction histidine kinase